MTDERLFTSPRRGKKWRRDEEQKTVSPATNTADLLAREDKRKAGGIEVKKHIVRYNLFPAKAANVGSLGTTCPSADCDTYPRCRD